MIGVREVTGHPGGVEISDAGLQHFRMAEKGHVVHHGDLGYAQTQWDKSIRTKKNMSVLPGHMWPHPFVQPVPDEKGQARRRHETKCPDMGTMSETIFNMLVEIVVKPILWMGEDYTSHHFIRDGADTFKAGMEMSGIDGDMHARELGGTK